MSGTWAALLLLVGCAHERPVAPQPAPAPAEPSATAPAVPSATAPEVPKNAGSAQEPESTASAPVEGAPRQPSAPPPAAKAGTGNTSAKTKVPGHGEGAAAAAPRTAAQGSTAPSAAGATAAAGAAVRPAPPSPPPLNLTSLEQRLKDTRAIGVFTKLSLKNQVDDLLAEFRSFHQGQRALTLSDLRQRFDLLLLKVLSLLQDGDPSLATAISASREAIWEILIDPQKFQKLARN